MAASQPDNEAIFHAARELAESGRRREYVRAACGGDEARIAHIEALLAAADAPDSLLDRTSGSGPVATGDPLATESPGTVIGPYRLLHQISEGGMGTVWMAQQHEPVKRRVAVKLIKVGMDSKHVIARFEVERQALAMMDHPNIAKVHDAGTTDSGRPYFVMELVDGVPITAYSDENRLTPQQRLELFVPVCQAIQHAHQKGIIHRDIKPANVLIASYDGRPVPKVIDFGVAKATGPRLTEATSFTGFGSVVGTPEYMSPEQAELDQLDIDTRSDIYALGVLLYELLTGTTPLTRKRLAGAALLEVLRVIREEEPPCPSTRLSTTEGLPSIAAHRGTQSRKLRTLVRGELDWIVMKALDKDRNRRYETANAFSDDVRRYLANEPVLACPPSAAYRLRKLVRRNKGPLAIACVAFSALLLGTIGLAVSNVLVTAERNARDKALAEKVQALSEKQGALAQAQANYREAKRQEGLAKDHERVAHEQEALARRRLYAAQMNLAMQAWRAGDRTRVLELLEGQRPGPDDQDLRGFEWYYLWRLCNGGRRTFLHGHTKAVPAVAFSPDGSTLASAGWDGFARLWDSRTGKERLSVHAGQPWQVCFSPDGTRFATGGKNEAPTIVWDAASGKAIHTIPETVSGLAFSPDGRTLAAGGATSRFWDVATGGKQATFDEPGLMLGFLADGATVATLADQGSPRSEIRFWDRATGARRMTIPWHSSGIGVLSPDRTRLAVVGDVAGSIESGNIGVWDTATGNRIAVINGGRRALAFSPDGQRLALGSEQRLVTVCDVDSGRQVAQDVHLDPVWGVAFSPDGKTLASSTLGGAIKLWDMTPAEEATTVPIPGVGAALRLTADGKSLLVGNPGPTRIIDLAAAKEIARIPAAGVTTIAADGTVLAGFKGADSLMVWDVQAGREIAKLPTRHRHDGESQFALSPNGAQIAVFVPWSGDNSVRLWDVAARQARTLNVDTPALSRLNAICVDFSPDGKLLAAGFQYQWVTIWDVASGAVKLKFSQPQAMVTIRSVAFSPDGKALAVGTDVGLATLWDVETGKRLASFKGHTNYVHALGFTPDGKTLATAGADKMVRLWDVTTGQERSTFTGHKGTVWRVLFSADGNTLATASDDGTVKLWRAAADAAALARRPSLDSDDPNYPMASQYSSSAWRLAASDDPGEGDPIKAVELAMKATELVPKMGQFWMTLGYAQYRAGNWQEALAALDRADELTPQPTVDSGLLRSMARWRLGDKAAARDGYRRASEWISQHAPYDQRFGRLRAEAAELLELSPPTSLIPALPPGAINIEEQVTKFLRERAALDERGAAAPKDLSERWKLAGEYSRVASMLMGLGEISQSEPICRQALQAYLTLADEYPLEIELDCSVGRVSSLIANVLRRAGRFEEALPHTRESLRRFQGVVDIRPDRPEYHDAIAVQCWILAGTLDHLKQFEEAVQAKRDAQAARRTAEELRKSPPAQDVMDTARPFAEKRDWKQAARELNRVFERQPRNNAFLCYSTALARLLAGDREGYARLAESMRAMRLLPDEKLDLLRTCTIHPGRAADAAALFDLAQHDHEQSANNWNAQNLGMVLYRAGRFDQALRWTEEAWALGEWYPSSPALAMIHHRLGHRDEARRWLAKAEAYFAHATQDDAGPLHITKETSWQDWAYFEVLLQEAKSLIAGNEGKPSTSSRTAN